MKYQQWTGPFFYYFYYGTFRQLNRLDLFLGKAVLTSIIAAIMINSLSVTTSGSAINNAPKPWRNYHTRLLDLDSDLRTGAVRYSIATYLND